MALATWLWVSILIFSNFIWLIVSVFGMWFAWMRGSGNWGGGKEVIDFEGWPDGGINRWRIVRKGPLYIHPSGGGDGIVVRVIGLFRQETTKVKIDDMIDAGDIFFHGRDGVNRLFKIHLENKDQIIVQLRNRISQISNELSRKDFNIKEILNENTKLLGDTAKAVVGALRLSGGGGKKK